MLLEAVRRCWSLVWNKYSGLGGRLRDCGCAWKEALRAQPVFLVVGNTWLQDLSRTNLCESINKEPQQAVTSAQESRPSLRLSLDLREKLIAPKAFPFAHLPGMSLPGPWRTFHQGYHTSQCIRVEPKLTGVPSTHHLGMQAGMWVHCISFRIKTTRGTGSCL